MGILLCDIYYDRKKENRIRFDSRNEIFITVFMVTWWLLRNCFYYGEYDLIKGLIDRGIVLEIIYIFSLFEGIIFAFFWENYDVFGFCFYVYIFNSLLCKA